MATLARLSFDDVSAIAEKVGYSTPAPVPREECNMTDKQSDHEHDPMVLLLSQTLERQSEIFVQGFKDVRHEMHTANRNQMILNIVSLVLMFALVAGSVAINYGPVSFESTNAAHP